MKRIMHILLCAIMAVSLFGCASEPVKDNGNEYAKSISEYFVTDKLYHNYHGYAESGFEIRFDGRESADGAEIYAYKGYMNDERGSRGDRSFYVTYTIEDNKVVENVDNNDYMGESENNIYSKIEDMVILSGEIKEGNSWEQTVVFDGEEKTAVTVIDSADDISFTTVTEIEAEGYENGVYTEERTYTKGSGLTSFRNTPYGSDKDDSLVFGYNFSIANENSITGME